jgi:hypothetical protein
VASTTPSTNGDVAVITKQLVGHVDNSAYPLVTIDIQATLTTPANATGPVPVIMPFGGGFGGARPADRNDARSSTATSRSASTVAVTPTGRTGRRS